MRKNLAPKLAVAGLLIAVAAAWFVLDLGQYFNQETLEKVKTIYAAHRYQVMAGYFLIYVSVTALSLPGALVMTLAGGALFGLAAGAVIISFASSIGAALAFVVARFLLRDWVQKRFGPRLATINEGVKREGAFYLFTLRLVPIFPFFVINLVMALTPMRLWTYYWISQLGMLPGTIVYVNAGAELGKISAAGDILSPSLVASFVILGLFPITVKKLLAWYRRKSGKGQAADS